LGHGENINYFDSVVINDLSDEQTHDLERDACSGVFEHFE
jgi:hypothetical protein